MSRYVAGQSLTVGQVAILDTLRGHTKRYGRKYCWPSQDSILQKLRDFHAIKISKRTLNYWLRKLERLGLIHRIRRLSREQFKSTVYYVSDWGGFGVVKAKKLIGYAKRLRSIFPSRAQRIANDRDTTKSQYSGRGLNYMRPHASKEQKRCETSELRKDVTAPSMETRPEEGKERPVEMRECLDLIYSKHKARLLGKG